jgi:serine/threonine protein kinase/Tfp pilus assembly protein PilF
MSQAKTELNLLFGLLALQNDLINRDTLVAAFQAWSRDKGRTLAEHLVDRGDLDADDRDAVEALVARYLRKHGDAEKSPAAVAADPSIREQLGAVDDPEPDATLGRIGPASLPTEGDGDGERTATYAFGQPTARGARFLLLRPHAKGGIGQVGVALDAELNREVALKEIQPQLADDPDCRGRFLLEAEVTGRLEHPGVVPVYGLGADPSGRPYYAMRLIRGDSLKQAIERFHAADARPGRDRSERALALRTLLNRFVAVCDAVAYAHSRGVIHRDLKPSNVMLGPYGETLVVDWGLAKVVGRDDPVASAEATLRPASAVGSGSSETQAGAAVGTPAYMSPEQAEGRLAAVGPASDVYSLGATLYCLLTGRPPIDSADAGEALARVQRGDFPPPRAVNPRVPPGLEAIALRAMAPRPADRYGSARELARDVEHWLADEPVSAYREPWIDRTRRWGRRHRTFVSAAAVLMFAAVVGLSVGAALLQRARVETENQRRAAVTARQRAEAINRFLVDDLLKQTDPMHNPVGNQLTVRQLLDLAGARLNAGAGRGLGPEVEAEVRSVIGHAYEYLGDSSQAESHYSRAVELRSRLRGADDPETLKVRNRLTWVIVDQGRPADAEPLALETLDACRRVFGEMHAATAEATDILGEVRAQQGHHDESIALHLRAHGIAEKVLGPDDPLALDIDNNLGSALVRGGRPPEALPIFQSVVDRYQRTSPHHPLLANSLGNLGGTLIALGRIPAAEPVLKKAVELGTRSAGPSDHGVLGARNLTCYVLEAQGHWEEAERCYRGVLDDRLRLDGGKPPNANTQKSLAFLARLYAKQKRWPDAARLISRVILAQHPDPQRKPETLAPSLAAALSGEAEPAAALPLLQECREGLKAPLWEGDWLAAEVASRYGDYLRRQGRFAEAQPILLAAADEIRKGVGVPPWSATAARTRVAELYDAWGKPAEAAKWRQEPGSR